MANLDGTAHSACVKETKHSLKLSRSLSLTLPTIFVFLWATLRN